MTEHARFDVYESTVVYRNPKRIVDGMIVAQEAHLHIDTSKMSQEFLLRLMWHMAEGDIAVKVAERRDA